MRGRWRGRGRIGCEGKDGERKEDMGEGVVRWAGLAWTRQMVRDPSPGLLSVGFCGLVMEY